MFMAEALATLHQGMSRTFDGDHPETEWRHLHVSTEYPVDEEHYPSVWVDLDVQGDISIAGIGHTEMVEDEVTGAFGRVSRWVFEGYATFTLLAMTSLERARLMDEVIRVLAFGRLEAGRHAFYDYLDAAPLIGLNVDRDRLSIRGLASVPGTPWGTDDMVYEVTIAAACRGEFVSTPAGALVPLSGVVITDEILDPALPLP